MTAPTIAPTFEPEPPPSFVGETVVDGPAKRLKIDKIKQCNSPKKKRIYSGRARAFL